MNAFSKTPLLLKIATGLLIIYVIVTFNYIGKLTSSGGAESITAYKHLIMVGVNILFLYSKNRFANYIAIIWLSLLANTFVSAILSLYNSGNISAFHLLNSYDFMRSLIFVTATAILICIALYNHYSKESNTNEENA